MIIKHLHFKRAVLPVLFVLLLNAVDMTNAMAQSFTVGDLNYSVNNDGFSVTVTGHVNGTAATGSLSIPEIVTYEGNNYSVTTIGYRAFRYCSGFTGSLTIPNSVTTIGEYAFYYCTGITGSLTIPNSVTSIGDRAFYNCNGFTGSLTIPNSVNSIGDHAFDGCSFNDLVVDMTTISANFVNNIGGSYLGSLTIGNSVTTIDDYAFQYCRSFTGSLTIGNSVTTIGYQAFNGCSGFTGSLTIGNSVTTIGDNAFYGCSGLTSVYYTGDIVQWCGITFASSTANPLYYGHNLYINNELVTELAIPDSATSIGDYAFINCSGFTGSLTIPNSVTTIGNYAFYNCSGFTGGLTIPNSVTTISSSAFSGCSGFTGSLAIPNSVTTIGNSAFSGCSGFTGSLTIPNSVTTIEYETFYRCSSFTGSLTIPNSVTTIGRSAFEGCSGFTDSLIVGNSVSTIGYYAFRYCNFAETHYNATNCADVASGYGAFFDWCGSLFIGDNVERIPANMFSNCTGFTGDLSIPNSVTSIGDRAFHNCNGFTGSLTIPNSVTTIGNSAFSGCSGFTGGLTIPNSVMTIGSFAFSVCNNLSFILNFAETPPSLGNGVFYNWNSNSLVYVPCGFDEAYSSLSWGGFSNFYGLCTGTVTVAAEPQEGGTVIGGGTFEGGAICTVTAIANEGYTFERWINNGTSVSTDVEYTFYVTSDVALLAHFVPEGNIVFADAIVKSICISHWDTNGDGELSFEEAASVTSLGNYFQSNTQITSFEELQYFTGLSSIGDHEFSGCNNLSGSLFIPNSVTTIGNCALYYCNGLTGSLTIPNSVTTIGYSAFYGCSGLTGNLTIGNSVTTIGHSAFYGCSGFTDVYFNATNCEDCQDYCLPFQNCSGALTIGDNVERIPANIFRNSGFTGSLTIPNSVTTIGNYAFQNCYGFTGNLIIGNSVTTIGNSAFQECRGFTSTIVLADTPPALGISVFGYWNSNKPSYVPCGFEDAYVSMFWGGFNSHIGLCGGTITVSAVPEECGMVSGGGTFGSVQTCTVTATANEGYVFAKWTHNGTTVSTDAEYTFLYVTGDMTIVAHFVPDGNIVFADAIMKSICVSHWDTNGDGELSYLEAASVMSLGDYFHGNSHIISFEELQYFIGLSCIDNEAFRNCSGLSSIVFPNSVTTIGNYAFYGCSGLTGDLTIPNSVTTIGNYAFYGCSGLTGDLTIPNSVTTINNYAFYGCSGLTGSLIIPNSVTFIGDYAFADCYGFSGSLTIPNSVTTIGVWAFHNCYGFSGSLTLPNSVTFIGDYAFADCYGFSGSLTIPNSVTTIGDWAFHNCYGFSGSLTIPNSVTTIGEYAFADCYGFSGSLTIPNSVTTIGDNAFAFCNGFTGDLTIPNSLTTISGGAFSDCSGFTGSLTIPNSVTTIGYNAFSDCSGFTGSLTIPNSVTTIGYNAFAFCNGFTGSLTIPNSVSYIGSGAFEDCDGFTGSLTIPNSVSYIGDLAFSWCDFADVILLNATPPSLHWDVFDGFEEYPIYVPYESLNAYKTANNWDYYEDRIFPMAYKTIAGYGEIEGNYCFIASPLVDSIAPSTVDNLINETAYDLYKFSSLDSLEEWQNYKAHTEEFSLINGQGYLYANENEVNIIFKGEFNEDEIKEMSLVYDANDERKCWNLVGNPFPCNAYLNREYYILTTDGTDINPEPIPATTPIPPCTAVFVKAVAVGETVVFTRVVQ